MSDFYKDNIPYLLTEDAKKIGLLKVDHDPRCLSFIYNTGCTKEELKEKLRKLANYNDPEKAHGLADEALLQYINDPEITELFNVVDTWYA